MNKINIQIEENNGRIFFLYEILGILHSIKNEIVSSDVGIWTLGTPRFIKMLENFKIIDNDEKNILLQCDELSTLKDFVELKEFNKKMEVFINLIENKIKLEQEHNIKIEIIGINDLDSVNLK